jgi:DHA2 family multidrug resistance protein
MTGAEAQDYPNRGLITVVVLLSTLMVALDITIANVALPQIMGSISASADEVTWVLTSYIIGTALVTPLTGWLEGRFGRKRLLLVAITGFTAASILCGASGGLGQIVACRLLQGIFGAPLLPLAQAQLFDMYPPEKQGQAMAIYGIGTLWGPIIGPALGGYLTDHFSWRAVFYINVPLGVLAVAGIWALLPRRRGAAARRFDFLGYGLLAVSLAGLQLLLDRGPDQDWFSSPEIWTDALLAGGAFWMFLAHSATAEHPFFSPRLARDGNLLMMSLFGFFGFMVMSSSSALLPTMLQRLLGYPVQTAGLVLIPRGAGSMAAMFFAGRLMGRIDGRWLILVGLSVSALALWQMQHFDLMMDARPVMTSGFAQGFGLGAMMVPASTLAFGALPPELRAEGSSMFAMFRNMGSSIGISMMQALLTRHTQMMHASLAAHVAPSDPVVRNQLGSVFGHAGGGRMLALDSEINRQASMVAYLDDFKLMFFMALGCMLLLLFIRNPRRRARETVNVASH